MLNATILPTANEAWGCYGTIRHHTNPAIAWGLATSAIRRETGCEDEAIRDFLDSRHGRHFADEVTNELQRGRDLSTAIERAVATWMKWRISRQIETETGIPRGLPYLTGFVTLNEILLDAKD